MTGIKTLAQKEAFEGYLELLHDSLFEKKNSFEKTLKNEVPLPYSEIIKAKMAEHNITVAEKWKLKPFLLKLKGELNELKAINLSIAFDAQETSIDRIYSWLNTNLGSNLILNLSVDPQLIGGATISFQGLYADYSLKRKLAKLSVRKLVTAIL